MALHLRPSLPLAVFFAVAVAANAQDYSSTIVPAFVAPSSILAGDFDQSGTDDLVVLFSSPSVFAPLTVVGIYLDPGTNPVSTLGSFAPAPLIVATQLPGAVFVRRIFRARLNSDTAPDLILESILANGQIALYRFINSGNGTFAAPTLLTSLPFTIATNHTISIGDFNADGVDELVLIAPQLLQLWDATGALLFSEQSLALAIAQRIFVGDWNGDGADDALIDASFPTTPTTRMAQLFSGQPTGIFAPTTVTAVNLFAPNGIATIASVADVDLDGFDDLVTMPLNPNASTPPTIRFGGAAGINPLGTSLIGAFATLPIAPKIDLVDLDGDRIPELTGLAASATSSIELHFGRIDPSAAPQSRGVTQRPIPGTLIADFIPPNAGTFTAPVAAFGDFDGDGDRDLILARSQLSTNIVSGFAYLENRSVYGSGCPGPVGIPRLTTSAPSITNSNFEITVASASPNRIGVLAISSAPSTSTPCLHIDTSPQNLILVNGSPFLFATDNLGVFTLSVDLTAFPSLAGLRLYLEALILDPAASGSVFGLSVAVSAGRSIDFY